MADVKFPVNVSKIDFNDIKQSFIDYLRTKADYQDFDFQASGWQYLLDILAYNSALNAFYLNMISSEMFLDSAQLQDSIFSKAKLLGYMPRSKRSARATIKVNFNVLDNNIPSKVLISRDSALTGVGNDGISYNFLVSNDKTLYRVNPSGGASDYISATATRVGYFTTTLDIVEGYRLKYNFTVSNDPNQRFKLPNKNVDVDSINVVVQESTTNSSTKAFKRAYDITEIESNSNVYFIQFTEEGFIEIYFGDGIISAGFRIVDTDGTIVSNGIEPGNIVIVEYIVCNGTLANDIKTFTVVESLGSQVPDTSSLGSPIISTLTQSSGGEDTETLQNIKNIAPLNYEMQNRAVTQLDFQQLLIKDYPRIESIVAWGGEDNDPPQYGRVFLSIKPTTGYVLSNSDKDYIVNNIVRKRSTMCVEPVIVDPDYLYMTIGCEASYDGNKTTETKQNIQQNIYKTIENFSAEHLERFNNNFTLLQLTQVVAAVNEAITSNLFNIQLKKILYPIIGIPNTYTINFSNQLSMYNDNMYDKALLSTKFYYPDMATTCLLAEKSFKSEVLALFRIDPTGLTYIEDMGTIDYNTGKVVINKLFTPTGWINNENRIEFDARPFKEDIYTSKNLILVIDPADISVLVIDTSKQ